MRRAFAIVLVGLVVMQAPARSQTPPEPDNYRNENYRAPTPQTLKGAHVLSTEHAEAVWKNGNAIFLDVMPHAPRPANLPAGTIWRERPRKNIPGSTWLPDTGYGALAAVTENYLRGNLERVTGGDKGKLLVVYCQRNCWMSWNAAKRVLAMGYTNVAWYPEGSDGWEDALLPLEESRPVPPE